MLKKLLLIERSKYWRCCWSKCWRCSCWSKDQSAEDVADQNAEDIVADRKVKTLKMLLIESSKCWRCCCWLKGLSAKDVADGKVKVLKMLLKVLLIERSKCWRCCWSKGQKMLMLIKELLSLNIEDEDYMMLKRFQWFIDVLPWWCWWCPQSLYPIIVVVDVVVEYPSC